MTKGIRWIKGQEYMLAGRCDSKTLASHMKRMLLLKWNKARIIKLWDYDFLLYVHGAK